MATNLKLDDGLVNEAVKLSGCPSKREAVNLALQEFVQRHSQMQLTALEGSIDFDPLYDYKKARGRH